MKSSLLYPKVLSFYRLFFTKLFLGVLLIIGSYSCSSDDENECCDPTNIECPNYDPCWNIVPSADFKMRSTSISFQIAENLQAEWCDTIYGSSVEFQANMLNGISYSWYVGNETNPRTGSSFKLGFSDYIEDTIQNINPEQTDYYLPLDITLIVRNNVSNCISTEDTLLTMTRQLVFSRKSLTDGTFVGRVEGENFDREIILWMDGEDPNPDSMNLQYYSDAIGLSDNDTLRRYWLFTVDILGSYKRFKWEENLNSWWIATDGIQIWDQEIITTANSPDRIELYYERYPEGSTELEIVKFSGQRVE